VTREQLLSVAKYSLGLGLGGVLFYLAFKDLSWVALVQSVANVNAWWLATGLAAMVLAHLLRALRWQQLLTAAGTPVSVLHCFYALMAGYLVNYAVPRLGEVTRCTLINRVDRVPIAAGVGTVVTERVLDVLVLLMLLGVLVVIEAQAAAQLLGGAAAAWQALSQQQLMIAVGVVVLLAGMAWAAWRWGWPLIRHHGIIVGVEGFIGQLWESMLSVRRIDRPWLFVLSTVGIWVSYALNTWLVLRALPEFGSVTLYVGSFLMAIGAIGMSLPVPGGIGSYHALIVLGVVIQGFSREGGQEAALLLHTSGLVVNVALGALGWWRLTRRIAVK
jgi:glycosyltransferase 2 family protein